MPWIPEFLRRIQVLANRDRFHRDLEDEMRLHVDLRSRALGAADPLAAQRQFGNATLLREDSQDVWSWRWLENLARDSRHAIRAMRRSPGFTAVAMLALALGIGANAAIFSVVNAVLLRPLAYRDPDRLVTVLHRGTNPVAPANYLDWRAQNSSFEDMAAAEFWTPNLTAGDHPEQLWGLRFTPNMLPMLGVEPLAGRWFSASEDQSGADHVAALSYRLWQRRFAGDPAVIGKPILLNGESYTIVAIMPPDFRFAPFWATRAEIWAPLSLGARAQSRGGNSLRVFARLRPGVSLDRARSEMAAITARLDREFPASNRDVRVTPLKEKVVGKVETPLLVVMGAVGFVLLIACANVAHMLLARAAARRRELAVRVAMGAGRWRLVRQFLVENLLLAAGGAALGLVLAAAGTRALVALGPASIPRVDTVSIDARVALFLLAITALTAAIFGLAPAFHASRVNLNDALKDGARGSSDDIRRHRARSLLVASEFALALMLLIGAGLMVRSFAALQAVDAGFDPHNVLTMVVSVAGTNQEDPARRPLFYTSLVDRMRHLPGVASAGAINHLPLAGDFWILGFAIEGRPKPLPGEMPRAVYRLVAPGYFETMRLPILRGRDIAPADRLGAPGAVIVNEEAARRYWPGENPIGRRITFDRDDPAGWLTAVGVARNAKQAEWKDPAEPEVYLAALQNRAFLESSKAITLVMRTAGDPAPLAAAAQEAVWSFDRNLPISQVLTMDTVVADKNAEPRFEMMLLVAFAAVALLLAAVGIYGVMSYSVARRTHEIGIRLSLGASRADVLRMVVRQGLALAAVGSVAGIAGALLLSDLMAGMLYGVSPNDPWTFGGVAAVLGFVALLATLIPATRAIRIDPIIALRHD